MTVLKLKEFRESKKWSQREIAKKLHMTQQGYCRWEQGLTFPNPDKILQLCEIFQCTPNDLFGIKGVHAVKISELKNES